MISSFILDYTLKYDFKSILDIGPGHNSLATNFWLENGKKVTSLDIKDYRNINHKNHNFICGNIMEIELDNKYDVVFASHILEHIQDTGLFLNKIKSLMKEDGVFFVVVPPLKHNIVGGHVHVWNMGLLMYNLILSGFDVRNGRFIKHGYNIAGIVKKSKKQLPKLVYDCGDIENLTEFFPKGFYHNINGDMEKYNWFD